MKQLFKVNVLIKLEMEKQSFTTFPRCFPTGKSSAISSKWPIGALKYR